MDVIYSEFPLLFHALVFICGALTGSFLNVVVHRIPMMISGASDVNLAFPSSHCPRCRHPISALDNIPILSWILLRGRCRHCGSAIPPRYPALEATCALSWVCLSLLAGPGSFLAASLILTSILAALVVLDHEHQLLPDSLTLGGLWTAMLLSTMGWSMINPTNAILGATAGYLCLWIVNEAYRHLRHRHAIAAGDFKMLALLGAWFGPGALPGLLLTASMISLLMAGFGFRVTGEHLEENPDDHDGEENAIAFGIGLGIAGVLFIFLQAIGWNPISF